MTDAPVPERVWILQGDAEEMLSWMPGRAYTVVAGPAEITNMHGKPASVKYTHLPEELVERVRDLYRQATTEHSHHYTASVLRDILATTDGEAK